MRLRKRVTRLVESAKSELDSGSRSAALELIKEAVRFDGNRGLVIEAILAIERMGAAAPPDAGIEVRPGVSAATRERKGSMASEDRLTELFASSESAYEQGDQAGAMNFLKQARTLAPDNRDVAMRMALLRRRIKSANLIRIARRELEGGLPEKAIVMARKAFELLPQADGLAELLDELESPDSAPVDTAMEEDSDPDADTPVYISEIRALVQENELEKAAIRAAECLEAHPGDELLVRFVERFSKLGLLESRS